MWNVTLAAALLASTSALATDLVPNGVDDTAQINNALATVRVATLGPGQFKACGILLPNAGFLRGYGAASQITKTPTCAGAMISLKDATVSATNLSDLSLNGAGLSGGLVNLTNDGAFIHGSHNIHNLTVQNDAGDCLTMGYGTRDSIVEHVRAYHCGGHGIKAAGADTQYNGIDVGSTGLSGFYADDSNPIIAGLKVWMSGYGTTNQAGLQCYQCYAMVVTGFFSQDNGGPAVSAYLADHIQISVNSDSDSGAANWALPAVSFGHVTNSVADVVISHRTDGLGIVSQGFMQDGASSGNATSITGVP